MRSTFVLQRIEKAIYMIRGQRVMLDSDLARLYGVTTFNLNKAVKRNKDRFPSEFMFHLTKEEYQNLIFHFGISSFSHGGRRHLPFGFTQEGVAMLSSVLRSQRAIRVNIEIMRAFVRLRILTSNRRVLTKKLEDLEKRMETHDIQIQNIFQALRQLMNLPEKPKRMIGFGRSEPPERE